MSVSGSGRGSISSRMRTARSARDSLAATAGDDGIVNVPGLEGLGAFAVATVNAGAAGDIATSASFGGAAVRGSLLVCETDPATAVCKAAASPTVKTTIAADATPTFSIFVVGAGDPVRSRSEPGVRGVSGRGGSGAGEDERGGADAVKRIQQGSPVRDARVVRASIRQLTARAPRRVTPARGRRRPRASA